MFAVTSDNGSFCAVEGFHVSVDEAGEARRFAIGAFFHLSQRFRSSFQSSVKKFMPFRLSATVELPPARPNSKSIRRPGHARADAVGRVRIPSTFRRS